MVTLRPRIQLTSLLFVSWQSSYFLAEIAQIPYSTSTIQGQGHNNTRSRCYQAIYMSGPSILQKWKEICCLEVIACSDVIAWGKVTHVGGGGCGGSVPTGTKHVMTSVWICFVVFEHDRKTKSTCFRYYSFLVWVGICWLHRPYDPKNQLNFA